MSARTLQRLRGKFIVFDGGDGAGKGVQRNLLSAAILDHVDQPRLHVTHTFDPGGTDIGNRIRHVLLDYDLSEMDVHCEALLFMASRAQLVHKVIKSTLGKGDTCVLCDRFVSATCAYQGAAGYDPKTVIELARFAIGDTWPDLTIVLDVPPETASQRTARKTSKERQKEQKHKGRSLAGHPSLFNDIHTDAMEARPMAFHERVRKMFLELPSYYPRPVAIVNGEGTPDEVHQRVMEALADAVL